MKEHNISVEKALELLGLYYNKCLGKATDESDGDTSYELSPETKMTLKWGITIPIILQSMEGGKKTGTIALVNSGATINCININLVRRMNWLLQKLQRPMLANNADRTNNAGGLIRHKIWLTLHINKKRVEQDFFATWLGTWEKVTLGHPWLTTDNPQINWVSGEVKLKGDATPRSPKRLPTPPWHQQLSGVYPYGWIVLPHQATREVLWRPKPNKWKMELQPEEFTNKPHQAIVNQENSPIPIYDTVPKGRNRWRRRQSSWTTSTESLLDEFSGNNDPWETRLIINSSVMNSDLPTEITSPLLPISDLSLDEPTHTPELVENLVMVDHNLSGG